MNAQANAQGVSYTTGVPAMIGAKLICEGNGALGRARMPMARIMAICHRAARRKAWILRKVRECGIWNKTTLTFSCKSSTSKGCRIIEIALTVKVPDTLPEAQGGGGH